jgi:hypothetical protein
MSMYSRRRRRSRSLLVAVTAAWAACSTARSPEGPRVAEVESSAIRWHAGNFRQLASMSGDIESLVMSFEHPNAGGYGKLSASRQADFISLLDALFQAIQDSLADGNTGDWCGVAAKAETAGYAVRRFYDTTSGRWFVYGFDTTAEGQSYFLLNPFAKRNLVIEVPHAGFEIETDRQGLRIFKALAVRALIVNKEHRCSDPEATTCDGTTAQCRGFFRESDVAHHPANTFTLLHQRLASDGRSRFAQLHGMDGRMAAPRNIAQIGDGTVTATDTSSVSLTFANRLRQYVPSNHGVHACQDAGTPPSPVLCGSTNLQGRQTNAPAHDPCTQGTAAMSGRFLHVEQHRSLRDRDDGDGFHWGDVRDALEDTWPACDMNNGAADCTLGPVQAQHGDLSCYPAKSDRLVSGIR